MLLVSCKESQTVMKSKMYSGINISDSVSFNRDKNSKVATLKIKLNQPWIIYIGSSLDSIDEDKPFLEGNTPASYTLDISDTTRFYFKLITASSTMVFAERHLPMEGGYNFRDLGGFKSKNGCFVKWGKLFRSDDMHLLTDADLKYISSIPLTTIVDFRSSEEISLAPDRLPDSVHQDLKLSITPGNLMNTLKIKDLTMDEADTLMMKLNILLVSDSAAIIQYKKFFTLLQNESCLPLMFHCSAGKDRTGMATALILSALEVDRETIFDDYLASNYCLSNKYNKYISSNPRLKSLFKVKKKFIEAGFDYMEKKYGSIENYLTKVLDVDLHKMKQLYLYD